jgi:hypothetical protein
MSLQEGVWGGQGISLNVSGAGASVEFDCAHGRIAQRIVPDETGRFELGGTHEEERGGPASAGGLGARGEDGSVREGGAKAAARAARYAGRVEGESMTLTVTLADGGRRLGTFRLVRGATPRLRKCR